MEKLTSVTGKILLRWVRPNSARFTAKRQVRLFFGILTAAVALGRAAESIEDKAVSAQTEAWKQCAKRARDVSEISPREMDHYRDIAKDKGLSGCYAYLFPGSKGAPPCELPLELEPNASASDACFELMTVVGMCQGTLDLSTTRSQQIYEEEGKTVAAINDAVRRAKRNKLPQTPQERERLLDTCEKSPRAMFKKLGVDAATLSRIDDRVVDRLGYQRGRGNSYCAMALKDAENFAE